MPFSIFLLPIRNNLPIRIILENDVMLITSENNYGISHVSKHYDFQIIFKQLRHFFSEMVRFPRNSAHGYYLFNTTFAGSNRHVSDFAMLELGP